MTKFGDYDDQASPPGTASILIKNGAITEEVFLSNLRKTSFGGAMSDETSVLPAASTSVPLFTFRLPFAFTVTEVRASLTTAGTGAALVTVDIHENGTTILSTKITIDATEKTSKTAVAAPVISDSLLADDAEIEVFLDVRDTDNVATGLKFTIIGYPT